MKNYLKKLIIMGVLMIPFITFAQNFNADLTVIGKKAFEALSQNKFETFKFMMPSQEDLLEIYKTYPFKSDSNKKYAIKNVVKRKSEIEKKTIETFKMVLENVKYAGVTWDKCTFVSLTTMNDTKKGTLENKDLLLKFKFYEGEYEVLLNECYKVKKGWVMLGGFKGPR